MLQKKEMVCCGIVERRVKMFGLSGSECLLYGGIAVMAAAVLAAAASIVVFRITGKKIARVLDEEYGIGTLRGRYGQVKCRR